MVVKDDELLYGVQARSHTKFVDSHEHDQTLGADAEKDAFVQEYSPF